MLCGMHSVLLAACCANRLLSSVCRRLDAEKRKAALLFSEVSRLGTELDSLKTTSEHSRTALQHLQQDVDGGIGRVSALVSSLEARTQSRSTDLTSNIDVLMARLVDLSDRTQATQVGHVTCLRGRCCSCMHYMLSCMLTCRLMCWHEDGMVGVVAM